MRTKSCIDLASASICLELTEKNLPWFNRKNLPWFNTLFGEKKILLWFVELFHLLWLDGKMWLDWKKSALIWQEKMVFCCQNCSDLLWEQIVLVIKNGILLPKLFWPTVKKIVLEIEKNFWNSRPSASNVQKFWDHWNNLFKQWKVRTIFGNRMLWGFS